ncbi:HAMP domain-containing protein [bacterium]|nr:HAMP domain-containing protein [bacterium]RQV97805.1 MAG: HAMP domain-containing protein [bacterium]
MSFFRRLYIKQKLILIIMIISSTALLLACGALIVYDQMTYRQVMEQKLQTLAEIIGNHCTAALIFDHEGDATETLSILLKAEKYIVFASLYDQNDRVFAKYKREDADTDFLPLVPREDGTYFEGKYLVLFREILLDGEKIGRVYIQSNLGEIQARLERFVVIVGFVLAILLLVSYFMTSKLQRIISKPILHLADIAREVSIRKDYTIRAEQFSQDELGFLTERFNEMLMQIDAQNVALQKAHGELEKRAQELQKELVERLKAEERIKASLKEKDVLLKEIHHRVKNNLQVICSLLYLQSKKAKDQQALSMFKESENRIRSMALIHEELYQSEDIVHIDFADYVQRLTHNLSNSYGIGMGRIDMSLKIDNVSLSIDKAIPCGLIINELVSNSLKYGFPDGSEGHIHVRLVSENENHIALTVEDNGIGLPKGFDFGKTDTLGLQLVHTLTRQLKGQIEWHSNDGASFKITFPV